MHSIRKSQRKSPTESATINNVGVTRTGNDGNLWMVVENSKGIKRWVKYSLSDDNLENVGKHSVKHSVKSPEEKSVSFKNEHILIFGEPSTSMMYGSFSVNDKMYRKITQEPKILKQAVKFGNKERMEDVGYVFGKLYKKSDYKEIGSHGNDVAQTGIIDITSEKHQGQQMPLKRRDKKQREKMKSNLEPEIDNIYKSKKYKFDWRNREALQELRKSHPEVLWLGETFGGDVGASYWAHYDKNKEMDSLIVSVSYFEKDDESNFL